MRKQVLKFVSVVLVAVVVLNLFAGSVLSLLLNAAEQNSFTDFSANSVELVVIEVPLHSSTLSFQKLNDHELFYNNKLYDIARLVIKDGIQYFYCTNDSKEEKILERIEECSSAHLDYYNSAQHPGQVVHKLFTVENFYLSSSQKDLAQADFIFHFMIEKFPQKIFFRETYPPPEIFFS